ncbi:unnamed protein product [Dicrocoelium dendriticum]|nr:unnamed protein product [Dicrocoelium dendriticum]
MNVLLEEEVSQSHLVVDNLSTVNRLLSLPPPILGTHGENVEEGNGSATLAGLWSLEAVGATEHRQNGVLVGGNDAGVQVGWWLLDSNDGVVGWDARRSISLSGPTVVDAKNLFTEVLCHLAEVSAS